MLALCFRPEQAETAETSWKSLAVMQSNVFLKCAAFVKIKSLTFCLLLRRSSMISIGLTRKRLTLASLLFVLFCSVLGAEEKVDFSSQIKPLFADRCFKCHGPDDNARVTDFRLDKEDLAFAELSDGDRAIVKGNSNQSSIWQRIHSDDPDVRMPPPDSNLVLSDAEKELITKWIRQGAKWQQHWAFTAPRKAKLPAGTNHHENENQIDRFVAAQLTKRGLSPSPEADKARLIRRVSFDLTGLPPSLEEIDAFVADQSPDAYRRLVDRLLTTDAYAERMTMEWLDVARYGDTQGMHGDRERHHWPWRDWVIEAFKQNMPYDEFIVSQLAGDLLPNAKREQKLATAFHRNHPVSAEGGIVDEEFRIKYVQDRVNTTAMAFMGLTLECATCHDHKFDPISQREYYELSAFFNNQKEIGMVAEGGGSSGPVLLLPNDETDAKLQKLSGEINQTRNELETRRQTITSSPEQLTKPITAPAADATFPLDAIRPEKIKTKGTIHRVVRNTPIDKLVDENSNSVASGQPDVVPGRVGNALRLNDEYDLVFLREGGKFELNEAYSAGAWIRTEKDGENQTVLGIAGELGNAWKGWDLFLDQDNRLSMRMIGFWPHNYMQTTTKSAIPKDEWHHVLFTYDGSGKASGIRLYIDGELTECRTDYDALYRSIVHSWGEQEGWPQKPVMVGRSGRFYTGDNGVFLGAIDHVQLFARVLSQIEIASLYADQTQTEASKPTDEAMSDHQFQHDEAAQTLLKKLRRQLGKKLDLLKPVKEIMVMADLPVRRKTFILDRGQYNAPTTEVSPSVPAMLLPLQEELPRNRLGLAKWLVDPRHPLTARVTVNRYWQMIFGRGIVNTPQDFGTQGAAPSHPKLLDWLAVDFIESGWDVRRLLKTMVMSATYRQSTAATPEQFELDPANIYLARGPSYRLPAEMIRDNALVASGLLNRQLGGASVKPYQPKGLWVEKTGPGSAYKHDSGERLYRRSMYTFVRRTTPHPAMTAFDAPNRSVCVVKREKTNTPLQALVLLNDPQFVEAARVLAQRVLRESSDKPAQQQVELAFRLVCGRSPSENELNILVAQYRDAVRRFGKDTETAETLLKVGEYLAEDGLATEKAAAMTVVANTILNFDEAYTKR